MPRSALEFTLRVEGLRETQDALRELLPDNKARTVMRRVLRNRAQPIAATMAQLAPVDPAGTETLRRSIGVSGTLRKSQRGSKAHPDDVEVYVGPSTKNTKAILAYAHLQEFGWATGSPQPFARPAWDQHKRAIVEGIGEELWAEIRKSVERAARRAMRAAGR